jgi:lysozyme
MHDFTFLGVARWRTDEGERLKVYNDATGEPVRVLEGGGVPTIGVGRNLRDRGISEDESLYLFNNDLNATWVELVKQLPWFEVTNPVWRDVIGMVHFNTGDVFAWPGFLGGCERGDAQVAAANLVHSEVGQGEGRERYARMAQAILNNSWGA